MNSKVVRVLLLIPALTLISTGYLSMFADRIPAASAVVINFILVPFSLGLFAAYVLKGRTAVGLLALIVLPVVHLMYFGGDKAKPGLENLLAVCEFAFLALGFVAGSLIRWLRSRARDAITRLS